jgi:hypothetical protein
LFPCVPRGKEKPAGLPEEIPFSVFARMKKSKKHTSEPVKLLKTQEGDFGTRQLIEKRPVT